MAFKSVLVGITGCSVFFDPISSRNLTRVMFEMLLAEGDVNPRSFNPQVIVDPADSTSAIRQKMIDAIKAQALADFGVTLPNEDILLPTYSTGLATAASETRTDSFTAPASGQIVDTSLRPLSAFSLTVKGVGGTPTAWTVLLEGSLDGANFTEILRHTQLLGIAQTVFSGSNRYPTLFMRSRAVSITLTPAAAIDVTILGVP